MASEPMELSDPLPPLDTMPVEQLVIPWVLALQRKRLEENLNKLIQSGDIPLSQSSFKVEADLSVSFVSSDDDDNESSASATPSVATPETDDEPAMITEDEWENFMELMELNRHAGIHVSWLNLRRRLKALRKADPDSSIFQKQHFLKEIQKSQDECYEDMELIEHLQTVLSSKSLNYKAVFATLTNSAFALLRLSGVAARGLRTIPDILDLFVSDAYNPSSPIIKVLDIIRLFRDIQLSKRVRIAAEEACNLLDDPTTLKGWGERNGFMDGFMHSFIDMLS